MSRLDYSGAVKKDGKARKPMCGGVRTAAPVHKLTAGTLCRFRRPYDGYRWDSGTRGRLPRHRPDAFFFFAFSSGVKQLTTHKTRSSRLMGLVTKLSRVADMTCLLRVNA